MLTAFLVLSGMTALAEDDRPVVQILGRSEAERPALTTTVTPQVVQVQTPPAPVTTAPAADTSGSISLPVGSIVAWANVFSNQPALPRGWLPCNGQVVDDGQSPLLGQALPDLNGAGGGAGRFLRGAQAAGGAGGSVTHVHEGYRSQKYGTQRSPVAAPAPANHLPPYYDVTWIIRIK